MTKFISWEQLAVQETSSRTCKSTRLVVIHNAVGTKRDSKGYVYIDQDSGSTYNDPSYAVLHEEALLVL